MISDLLHFPDSSPFFYCDGGLSHSRFKRGKSPRNCSKASLGVFGGGREECEHAFYFPSVCVCVGLIVSG